MSLDHLFKKVIADALAQHAFQDMPQHESAWARAGADMRSPRYEGDFATSTDASFLLEQGVAVPQAAMNATRVSVAKTLDKIMPDGALREWFAWFLAQPLSDEWRFEAKALMLGGIQEMPQTGRIHRRAFDFRVGTMHGRGPKHGSTVFTRVETANAKKALCGDKAHVLLAVALWQVALREYVLKLSRYAQTQSELSDGFRERLKEFCTFLSDSAFRLASFGALLPLALAINKNGGAGAGVAHFAQRGGFMRKISINLFHYIRRCFARTLPFLKSTEKPPMSVCEEGGLSALGKGGGPRMGVCAAIEALVRWAQLPISVDGQEIETLDAFIAMAKRLSSEEIDWADVLSAANIKPRGGCPFGKQAV